MMLVMMLMVALTYLLLLLLLLLILPHDFDDDLVLDVVAVLAQYCHYRLIAAVAVAHKQEHAR